MGESLGFDSQTAYEKRLQALTDGGFALWDVIGEFVRPGSLDSAFVETRPNDFEGFFAKYPSIKRVAFNGKKAMQVFDRRVRVSLPCDWKVETVYLPSTSPANASWSYRRLLEEWQPWLLSNQRS